MTTRWYQQVPDHLLKFFSNSRNVLAVVLALCLAWIYLPALAMMVKKWATNSDYSHGFVVPVFSLYLVWRNRKHLAQVDWQINRAGAVLLGLGLLLHFVGIYFFFDWFRDISLLPTLAGFVLFLGGWKALRWTIVPIAFLIFMIPLPYSLETALAYPLRRSAAIVSVYALQTLGFVAFREGTTIQLVDVRIGVAQACSGLSMLFVFFGLSPAVCILSRRHVIEKGVILLSAVPIAILSNMIRIIVTSVLHKTAGSEWAEYVFHDVAGWMMMVLALLMLWAELSLFAWVLRDKKKEEDKPSVVPTNQNGTAAPTHGESGITVSPKHGESGITTQQTVGGAK
ncbi:MAG: exosortase/archaeosortase family protein [Gemmataceae bacterium]